MLCDSAQTSCIPLAVICCSCFASIDRQRECCNVAEQYMCHIAFIQSGMLLLPPIQLQAESDLVLLGMHGSPGLTVPVAALESNLTHQWICAADFAAMLHEVCGGFSSISTYESMQLTIESDRSTAVLCAVQRLYEPVSAHTHPLLSGSCSAASGLEAVMRSTGMRVNGKDPVLISMLERCWNAVLASHHAIDTPPLRLHHSLLFYAHLRLLVNFNTRMQPHQIPAPQEAISC